MVHGIRKGMVQCDRGSFQVSTIAKICMKTPKLISEGKPFLEKNCKIMVSAHPLIFRAPVSYAALRCFQTYADIMCVRSVNIIYLQQ